MPDPACAGPRSHAKHAGIRRYLGRWALSVVPTAMREVRSRMEMYDVYVLKSAKDRALYIGYSESPKSVTFVTF